MLKYKQLVHSKVNYLQPEQTYVKSSFLATVCFTPAQMQCFHFSHCTQVLEYGWSHSDCLHDFSVLLLPPVWKQNTHVASYISTVASYYIANNSYTLLTHKQKYFSKICWSISRDFYQILAIALHGWLVCSVASLSCHYSYTLYIQ